jgi:hypothetical protein
MVKERKPQGPHIVDSGQSELYKKHTGQKNLLKRLTASSSYLFATKINGSASFYSPDKATSLLLDDLKSRSAEFNAMIASLPKEEQEAFISKEPVQEIKSLLRKEGIRYSEKKIADALYKHDGYGPKEVSGLLAAYCYILGGLRLPINKPDDFLTGRSLIHQGLDVPLLDVKDHSSLEELFVVLKKEHLDPFAKIALLHFFYLHSGLFMGKDERFLYLLLTVLVADSYSSPFGYTLARHLSAKEKKIDQLYKTMVKESSKADLDRFVYSYAKMLSAFLDEEILDLRKNNL